MIYKRKIEHSTKFCCMNFIFSKKIFNNYTSKYPYIALIIDDRTSQELVNAVINILQHIPTDWKIQIITPVQNWSYYNSSSLYSLIANGRVCMTSLDFPRVDFTGSEYINLLLTSASLWDQVQGEKILYFQTDSVICSNSSYKLIDFLQYDFIGAPWHSGGCCNGGFSLRSRRKMLQLLNSDLDRYRLHETNEDVWLSRNLPRVNAHIASTTVAKKFSVESIYHPRPFAVHKPNFQVLGSVNMKHLCSDCPEVRTISSHC
ncbi:unnamed protein product [Rotaria socialis]